MFETKNAAPPDAILGLNAAFAADDRSDKTNLGVGVYKNDAGITPTMAAVRQAELRVYEQNAAKTYLPISGPASYGDAVQRLIFGKEQERAQTAQTPGGTGALRVAGDFIAQQFGASTIWVSDPTWGNHANIFRAAGHTIKTYPYYDAAKTDLDFPRMLEALKKIPAGDVVLLHACCHNPTGFDPNRAEWDAVAQAAKSAGWLPLFDMAYQGFADGLDDDPYAIHKMMGLVPEMLIASSFSKNFGLYNERVGALTLIGENKKIAEDAFTLVKRAIRTNYSNPPRHGSAIVETIFADDALFSSWKAELETMRQRIASMRAALGEGLKNAATDFSFVTKQRGMFSYTGLSGIQVDALREKHGIYAVRSGRINIAGLTTQNIGKVCAAISAVETCR